MSTARRLFGIISPEPIRVRAFIYCRVSSQEQTKNFSLSTQEESCREWCRKNGYDVADVFIDAGESARTTNRPEFIHLLQRCRVEQGRVHAVVVYSLTRFSRNTADHHAIATLLRGLGITLRSVTEPIDDSPSGRLMEAILAGMAQFDNDTRTERIVVGMGAALSRGRWIWVAPVGYRTGVRGGPSLVVDESKADLIRQAFELVASGRLTGRPLAKHLYALGLRGRTGARVGLSRLYAILRNPLYAGRIESRGLNCQGDFTPIVSEDLFAQVQRRLAMRGDKIKTATRHRNHPDFPLRRFVRCATCQKALTGGYSKGRTQRYAFYHCKAGCSNVSRELLEQAFLELMNQLVPDPGWLALFRRITLSGWREEATAEAKIVAKAHSHLTRLESQLQRVEHAYLFENTIDAVTYREQRNRLREEIAMARLESSEAQAARDDIESMVSFTEYALTQASAMWTAAGSVDERIRIQETMFPEGLQWRAEPRFNHGRQRGKGGRFVEPKNVLEFYQLAGLTEEMSGVVDPAGTSWNQLAGFLHRICQLRDAA